MNSKGMQNIGLAIIALGALILLYSLYQLAMHTGPTAPQVITGMLVLVAGIFFQNVGHTVDRS